MAPANLTYYRQIEDYATGLIAYIIAATGESEDRIIYSPPDVALRKLKEKLAEKYGYPAGKTVEIDQYISFYFPFASPGVADYRQSPQQSFWGGIANASRLKGWVDQFDLHVEINIWGGPDQFGRQYTFEKRMVLENYMYRHQRIQVTLRDLVSKDPVKAKTGQVFDANCWYEFLKGEVTDNSEVEALFQKGSRYRATAEFTWYISLFKVRLDQHIGDINRIIYMFKRADE